MRATTPSSKTPFTNIYVAILGLAIAFTLTACSGVSGSATNAGTTTPTISLNQTSANVMAGGTTQFTATVQDISNTAVSWSVDGVAGGNATAGTISAAGLYTAPSQPGSHKVVATIQADPSISAGASVVVGMIGITPSTAIVAPSGTQQFSATIQGFSSAAVTWSVDNVTGGNATVGTISASGLYSAPAQAGSHTVMATSVADTSATASASVTISTIGISPTTVTMIASTTQQFTAAIPGSTNAGITWTVDGVVGGNSTVGTITASGLYTAPAQAGSHTVTAAATANPTLNASATVNVFVFTISPTSAIIAPSGSQQFSVTIQGLTNTGATWAVDGVAGGNATVGTITSGGLYTAPSAVGAHTVAATSQGDPSASVSATVTIVNGKLSAVLTYHNDNARDGAYLDEVSLTPSNVNATQFGKILSYPVNGQIYAQPLYLPQVTVNGATHNVVYVGTQNNYLYAFDADATASTPTTFWQLTPATLGPSLYKGDLGGPYPNIGILSTPVIDAGTNIIYFVVQTSNTGPNGTPFFLYAVNALTGAVINHVPINATDTGSGDVLDPSCYQRMGLALNPVTNWIYIAFGSCSHGWLLAYDKNTLAQKAVFDDTAGQNPGGGGLWSSGGAPAIDDTTGNIYLMSGVDAGDQNDIKLLYNDSFLNLNPNTLAVQTYFSPDNNLTLATNDADLGSGSPVLIPGNATYPQELVGGGKDGNIYVVDPLDMGGYNTGSNGNLQTVTTGSGKGIDLYDNLFSTPVYWNGILYYHSNDDVLRAFSWSAGAAAGQQLSKSPTIGPADSVYQMHGATASLSANGAMNGIIWDIDNSGYVNTGNGTVPLIVHAYDATDVANELYNSSQAGTRDTAGYALKFTVPTIANGRVFVPTANELDIYGLLP